MTQAVAKLTKVEVDLYWRQAAHHLSAAEKHKDKWNEHRKAAALLLIQLKENTPHGKFELRVMEEGISPRTAQRVMQEYLDPQAEEVRQEQQRKRDAENRRYAEEGKRMRAEREAKSATRGGNASPAPVSLSPARAQLIDLAKRVPDEHIAAAIRALHQFIN